MKIAQATDWKTIELPPEQATLNLERMFTPAEMEQVRRGYVPVQMEDKWFIYWENDSLYLHRSWTGFCVFVAHIHEEHDGYVMRNAKVNRNPEQYSETSHDESADQLYSVIDTLLLRLPLRCSPGENLEDAALRAWAELGRVSHGKHPE